MATSAILGAEPGGRGIGATSRYVTYSRNTILGWKRVIDTTAAQAQSANSVAIWRRFGVNPLIRYSFVHEEAI